MADTPARLKIRRDVAATWASVNPVLADGELAFETDTLKLRIGDGATAFTSLPYIYADLGKFDAHNDGRYDAAGAAAAVSNSINPVPVGASFFFPVSTPPAGYLAEDGSAISRTSYATLYGLIGTLYGAGDGSSTFNLRDMRGVVPRGWDNGRGLDSGRSFGSYQADDYASHSHGTSDPGHSHGVSDPGHSHGTAAYAGVGGSGSNVSAGGTGSTGSGTYGATTGIGIAGSGTGVTVNAAGGTETRMKNVSGLWCIKY